MDEREKRGGGIREDKKRKEKRWWRRRRRRGRFDPAVRSGREEMIIGHIGN